MSAHCILLSQGNLCQKINLNDKNSQNNNNRVVKCVIKFI